MYQVLWSASVCQLSDLPCIKYFGLPVSVSCPICRNVNDEQCLPLVSVSQGCTSLLSAANGDDRNHTQTEEFLS